MTTNLAEKQCTPCKKGTPPLKENDISRLMQQLAPGWQLVDGHHLEREFSFPNFREALSFVNQVGEIAEQQGHHPDIYLSWGKVKIQLWTHKINGLSDNDFIFAAKTDKIAPVHT